MRDGISHVRHGAARRGLGLFRLRSRSYWLGVGCCLGLPGAALAQSTSILYPTVVSPSGFSTLVAPVLSPDYQRGHNVAVLEEGQPDYDAAGSAVGSFTLHPQVTVGAVADNNVYVSETDRKSDISAVVKPSFVLTSDWSRHLLQLSGSTDLRRYATQSRRDQNSWDLYPQGQVDLGSHFVLHAEARAGQYYESPYGSDLSPEAQILSHFTRTAEQLKGVYTGGRVRFSGLYDHSAYEFTTLHFPDGTVTNQSYRNRTIDRVSGQAEYALSPSLAVYGLAVADQTRYPIAQNAQTPRESSNGQTYIAGVSFDLAGVMRGMVGVGYTRRSYLEVANYDVGAFSAQVRLDFFPYRLTTVSITGGRLIQDSGLGFAPYIDERVMAEVDQSLRENLVVVLNAGVVRQTYVGSSGASTGNQFQASVRYQASRWLGFQTELSYRSANQSSAELGISYSGMLMGLSMTVRR